MTFTMWSYLLQVGITLVLFLILILTINHATSIVGVLFSSWVILMGIAIVILLSNITSRCNPVTSDRLYVNSDYYKIDNSVLFKQRLEDFESIKEIKDICLKKYHEKASIVVDDSRYYYDYIQIKSRELRISFGTYLKSLFCGDYALAYQYDAKTTRQSKYVSIIGKLQKNETDGHYYYSIGNYKLIDNQNKLSKFVNQNIEFSFVYKSDKKANSKYITDFIIVNAKPWNKGGNN